MSTFPSTPPHARRRLGLVVALSCALLVVLTLLAAPTSAAAAKRKDIDAPNLPARCYGPGQTTVKPFPCPLVKRKGKPTLLLWGDSHAYMYIPALREVARRANINLVSFVAGACAPAFVNPKKKKLIGCERSNLNAFKTVRKWHRKGRKFSVLLSSNWSGFRIAYRRLMLDGLVPVTDYTDFVKTMVRMSHQGTPKLFQKLGKLGVAVDVIGPSAVVPEHRAPCAAGEEPYRCDLPRWQALPEENQTNAWLRQQLKKTKGKSLLIDTSPGYCTKTVCHGTMGRIVTWYDDLHLSATRTRNLQRYFTPAVQALKRRAK